MAAHANSMKIMAKKTKKAKIKLVEIVRSFSYKLNLPGLYESRDFFCSQKAECKADEVDTISEALHNWCKTQVIRDVNKFLAEKNVPDQTKMPIITKEEMKDWDREERAKEARMENQTRFQENREAAMRSVADEEN